MVRKFWFRFCRAWRHLVVLIVATVMYRLDIYTTGPCGRGHLALALLTIIKRDRYASAPVVDRQVNGVSLTSQASKFWQFWSQSEHTTLVVQRNTKVMQSAPCQCQNDEKYSKSCPSFMYHTPLQAADDFHAKTRLTSRIMRVTPEIRL